MQRKLKPEELRLIEFLILVNAPLYSTDAPRWLDQVRGCTVHEVNVPYCLSISHGEIGDDEGKNGGEGWGNSHSLARELVALDEGVPVLIYGIARSTEVGLILDSFNIDRLDGEPLSLYPEPGDKLMIVEGNQRVGGADLRGAYGGSAL
jgi:hypothetical protein